MSIDVWWVWAVDGRMVSVEGGRRVSFDEQVLLSIDVLRFPLQMVRSRSAGSEKRSACYLLSIARSRISAVAFCRPIPTTGCRSIHLSARRSMQLASCRSLNLPGSVIARNQTSACALLSKGKVLVSYSRTHVLRTV
ncbi:hypothetical protein IGI04_014936 [Brassica rapa subsp. trilocularis]|uniref:Uncharacterized protein n=1 Tax=Brassica rapa subsp. trilocularis TaxID=1813537 RepID=A0ABQ7MNM3_BRACM|nr:hypothetical protein IGI04_014936 [Brassica rapa subsp. trilocularis]